jgi:Flp pilus assembly protein TadD
VRAASHWELHHEDLSLTDYAKAILLAPGNAWHRWDRASIYKALRQYDKAVADYSKGIELEPKNAWAWNNRAFTFQLLQQYDKAIGDLQKVAELENSAMAWNNLAWLLATCPEPKLRDPQRAVEFAKKAVELAPKDGTIWNTLGAAHYRAGDRKAALAALDKSMGFRQGGDSFDWLFIAMAHWQLGAKDEARKWYEKAIEWMDKNAKDNDELRRFRTEAEELLEIKKK